MVLRAGKTQCIVLTMNTVADIVALWPKPHATQLAKDIGLPPVNVRTWVYRNIIPSEFWERVLSAAASRELSQVTADLLMRITAEEKRKRRDAA